MRASQIGGSITDFATPLAGRRLPEAHVAAPAGAGADLADRSAGARGIARA